MVSQTLEILRQGVWASLTGGWFFDPHQDVYCNTFHLYLWLFLLCFPFTVYLYSPPEDALWYIYCVIVTIVFGIIKLINLGLHHMYDTTECITIEPEDNLPENERHKRDSFSFKPRREEEGIELQELSTKRHSRGSSNASYNPAIIDLSNTADQHDIDSIDSTDYPRHNEADTFKAGSTIDLKVDVHRKNSSESSEEISFRPTIEPPTNKETQTSLHVYIKIGENQRKHIPNPGPAGDASTILEYVALDESAKRTFQRRNVIYVKKSRNTADNANSQECNLTELSDIIPTTSSSRRRHSNNSSLGCLPAADQINIKPTGSLELGYIDKNLNTKLTPEGFNYWKNNRSGVRRIRSTALETCCPPATNLVPHPNSLEVIGPSQGSSNRNFILPPPSSTLVRNPHLSLCPYFSYGSEIVYPIAEQSDEHQTSHGPDTDIDSVHQNSDSDYEEQNAGSRSPLLFRIENLAGGSTADTPISRLERKSDGKEKRKNRRLKNVIHKNASNSYSTGALNTNYSVFYDKKFESEENVERTSATSKDALLENDVSNSSATPEMHDARTDCNITDNDYSEKKLSECSLYSDSDTSVDLKDTKNNRRTNKNDGQKTESKKFTENNSEFPLSRTVVGTRWSRRVIKKRKNKRTVATTASQTSSNEDHTDGSSVVGLNSLFETSDSDPQILTEIRATQANSKEAETGSSSTTASLENDVYKMVTDEPSSSQQWPSSSYETPKINTNLGAIPKQGRPVRHRQSLPNDSEYRPRVIGMLPKSESERRRNYSRGTVITVKKNNNVLDETPNFTSSKHESHSVRAPRMIQNQNSVDGLECLVVQRPNKKHSRVGSKSVNRHRSRNSNCAETSSSNSNNELSSLLPVPATPFLAAFLESRHNCPPSLPPRNRVESAILSNLKRGTPVSRRIRGFTHLAESHNDTSDGSMHCFRDEYGSWWTYTFDERGTGVGLPFASTNTSGKLLHTLLRQQHNQNQLAASGFNVLSWSENNETISNSSLSLNSSSLTVVLDSPSAPSQNTPYPTEMSVPPLQTERRGPIQVISNSHGEHSDTEANTSRQFRFYTVEVIKNMFPQQTCYYKYKLWPRTYIKIYTDRLSLLALLDRNLTLWETILSIILAGLVACLGAVMLSLHFFEDLYAFLFCFVIAGCQYSLMKSVQPDAASPTHGFNRIMAFSRPVYFCICSTFVIILHYSISSQTGENSVLVYGINWSNKNMLTTIKDILSTCLLCFPIAFSLGLCPQINTFTMYFLEQVDIHIFGGNAMISLIGSFYSVARSLIAVFILYGFAYGALIEDKCSQHILFSMFCGCLISCAYNLSRLTSDPSNMWYILKTHFWPPDIYREPNVTNVRNKIEKLKSKKQESKTETENTNENLDGSGEEKSTETELIDPLPNKLQKTVNLRLKNDIIICSTIAVLVFGIHTTNIFSLLKQEVVDGFKIFLTLFGLLVHYIIPQLRKQLPWLCFARPFLRSYEYGLFEVRNAARVMWFEKIFVYLCFIERNFLYPVLFLISLTQDACIINNKFGPHATALVLVVCGLKVLRGAYSDSSYQYLVLGFTTLFFRWDFAAASETFIIDYFVISIFFNKIFELILKLQFVVTYIAPWQITWGSAFHAFAQPFSVPHSAMLFLQTILSAILSTPLNPFLGSAIFLISYVRPIKFWERDYNTRRVDHSNTRLSSHLDRNLGADDNNLNSIFYEHLTRSLQHSLCGDLMMGRWGPVSQGDCFVLASDYLNCLVHVIELGNGLVTFQMRGLEFRGTYCQQREVEAISEGVEENVGCCCCELGHLPNVLSVNAAFSQRWLAWEVTSGKYVLEGYSISDNNAVSMLQVFDFRKVLITYYVKSIIYYTTRSPKLDEWLKNQNILDALSPMFDKNFIDLDPVFNVNIDEDFDFRSSGITRGSFCSVYLDWIQYCALQRNKNLKCDRDSNLVLLCFALSLLGRRTLGTASHNTVSNVELFLYGLHALFKGDFRITSIRDEWVFTDVDLLRKVVAPAVRMSLKLHQDHLREPDEYEDRAVLYLAISDHNQHLVISHEGDPAWRNAVLSGTPSLLALRHVLDDGTDEYKIIMLNKRFLSFRVIKINRECVRGLWSGQQQELVYLRNRNPERGSIQNAKQALRNIINSSCDQPIGYPIYVSPLTTSYAETNEQLCSLVGGSLTLLVIKNTLLNLWKTIRRRCGEGCLSGGSVGRTTEDGCFGNEGIYAMTTCTMHGNPHTVQSHSTETIRAGTIPRGLDRSSMMSSGKPGSATLASLAGLLSDSGSFRKRDDLSVSTSTVEQSPANDNTDQQTPTRVKITDPNVVYDAINLGRRIDVIWPDEKMRARGGRSYWKDWLPEKGMEGTIVHRWIPSHKDANKRSHVDRTILLVKIDDKYVPIAESGVQDIAEV